MHWPVGSTDRESHRRQQVHGLRNGWTAGGKPTVRLFVQQEVWILGGEGKFGLAKFSLSISAVAITGTRHLLPNGSILGPKEKSLFCRLHDWGRHGIPKSVTIWRTRLKNTNSLICKSEKIVRDDEFAEQVDGGPTA